MKITVGSILFNSETVLSRDLFTEWLKCTYEIGDEIIFVEGATKATSHYWDGDTSWATATGKSADNTIKIIKAFPDPMKKITLIEKDGFWNGKTEMCNEWAKRMTGNYIWQVDNDEFYLKRDIQKIKEILEKKRPDAVHFYANHFWGNFHNRIDDETGSKWANSIPWMRIFKHESGAKWISHEPPKYVDPHGTLYNKDIISRDETLKLGIKMFHYAYVKKTQIDFKSKFFRNKAYSILWERWQKDNNAPLINGSKTCKFDGDHPFDVGLFE